ncbi:MAG: hypothetical protein QXG91_01475 [Candidatus Aenigmatarchaeota archaeon]
MFGIYFYTLVSVICLILIFLLLSKRKKVVFVKASKTNHLNKVLNGLNKKKYKVKIIEDELDNLSGKFFSLIYFIDWKKDVVEQLKEFELNKNKFLYSFIVSDRPTKLEEILYLKRDIDKIKSVFS